MTQNKIGSGVISVLGRWIHLCVKNVLSLPLTFAAIRVRHTTPSRRRWVGWMGEVQLNHFSCLTTGNNILRIGFVLFFFHGSMWFLSISFTKPSVTGIVVK